MLKLTLKREDLTSDLIKKKKKVRTNVEEANVGLEEKKKITSK